MYFRLGQGKDYIYEYEGRFIGVNEKDVLNPTLHQKTKYDIQSVADIFPKYYIIRVEQFKDEKIKNKLDEWVYFLKNSEIKEEFTAKGMNEAKVLLRYERMSTEDQIAYDIHIKNRRIEASVIETAMDKAKRQTAIEIAKNMLNEKAEMEFICRMTKLTQEEVLLLAQGKVLDKDDE